MEQPAEVETPSSEHEPTVGRRQLLKTLVAGGATVAFTQLPRQWTAPLTDANNLPVRVQISGTQPNYSGVCDSQPGGGDLQITNNIISNIQPYLQLISGVASLQGIPATMTVEASSGSALNFNPPVPQTVNTNSAGRASFGNLSVTGNPGDSFFLVFNFATPHGNVQFRCGEFFFGATPTQ